MVRKSVERTIFALVLILVAVTMAYGHDNGTRYADWFTSLKQPHNPTTSCCGVADQYYVKDYRPSQQPGTAFIASVINNKYGLPDLEIEVPEHTIMHNQHSPTGRSVIFVSIRASEPSASDLGTCDVPRQAGRFWLPQNTANTGERLR